MQPFGGVELLVTVGSHLTQVTVSTNFLIVDAPFIYNAIIGQPTLNALRAVVSTYHLTLNFLTPTRVEVVYGN